MFNGEKFTARNGSRFEISQVGTWTTLNGTVLKTGRLDSFNPAIGHGGSCSINELEWNHFKEMNG